MIEFEKQEEGTQEFFVIRIEGRLSEGEYQVAFPQIKSHLEANENLLVLFHLDGLEGWDTESRWQNLNFDSRHQTVVRVGILGGRRWQRWIRRAFRPLRCPVRSFETLEASLKWLLRKKDPPESQRPSKAKVTSLCVARKFIERFETLGF